MEISSSYSNYVAQSSYCAKKQATQIPAETKDKEKKGKWM